VPPTLIKPIVNVFVRTAIEDVPKPAFFGCSITVVIKGIGGVQENFAASGGDRLPQPYQLRQLKVTGMLN